MDVSPLSRHRSLCSLLSLVATAIVAAPLALLAGCAASSLAEKSTPAARTHLHLVHAARLYGMSAENGSVTAGTADPAWSIRIVPAGPVTVEIIASKGNTQAPAALTLVMISVTDLLSGYYAGLQQCTRVAQSMFGDVRTCEFNNIQHHAAVAQRQWNAVEGMRAVASAMPSYGDYPSNLSIRPRSSTVADVSYSETVQGEHYDDVGVMQMAYVPNPYLSQFESGTPEFASLGFLSACRAAQGQLATTLRACRAVLGSMRFSNAFKAALVQRAMNEYASQVQTSVNLTVQAIENEAEKEAMISQFSHNMAALQAQRDQIIARTNAIVDRGWWNVLGGLTDLRDSTTGREFNVSDDYRYYCRDAQDRVLGTNDSRDLSSLQCAAKLDPVSPGFGGS